MARLTNVVRATGAILGIAVLAGWGTLADPIKLEPGQEEGLRKMISMYGVNPAPLLAQLDDRSGPHPVHQFIAYQAYLLLKEDPAYADNTSGFPTGEQINTWDGIERDDGFMNPSGDRSHLAPGLGPSIPGFGGPSADAERMGKLMGFNKLYNGRAHYWNPWLEDGAAPKLVGHNFARLAFSIAEDGDANTRAHYAAYMAHYLSDVTSAKHADAFTLDNQTVAKLEALAKVWINDNTLMRMLASPQLAEAEALLRARPAAINPGVADAYWQRIDARMPLVLGDTMVTRGTGPFVDIPASSMLTATACYLHALGHRPKGPSGTEQEIEQFFTYFDPLYFNGPIVDKYDKDPVWGMCTGFSEHLQWESNPAHFKTVMTWMAGGPKSMLWRPGKRASFQPFTPATGYYSPDPTIAAAAMTKSLEDLTKSCSKQAHGAINNDRDFGLDHMAYLELAIRCVYTAYRASITALRLEANGRRIGDTGVVKLALTVKNLADKPAKVHHAKIAFLGPDGVPVSRSGWTVPLAGKSIAAGDLIQFRIKVDDVPETTKVEDLYVVLRGEVEGTPDSGLRRAKVEERELKIIHQPGSGAVLTDKKGPIDIVVVIDTTGSMEKPIVDMRDNAIKSIKKLRETSSDIRLAITTFRDYKEKSDLPHFKLKAFTSNLEEGFAFLNGLTTGGGGDTPEDLLDGIARGIELWEKEGKTPERMPTKIIITITDAAAHSPDSKGNTFKSIAKRAYEVDPAHIYSIVVGDDAAALEHAKILSDESGGKVVRASKGEDVAEAVLSAVASGVEAYSGPAVSRRGAPPLAAFGIVLAVVGGVLLLIAMVLGRLRREVATDV